MTASYLTTDIIVIIVLAVVLVLVGAFAFLIHYYWTRIGVSEIWNTTKWSSIRSSIFRAVRRFSGVNNEKFSNERPFSAESLQEYDINGIMSSNVMKNPNSPPYKTSYIIPSNTSSSTASYNNPVKRDLASRIVHPSENSVIYSIHEHSNEYDETTGYAPAHRF